MGPRLKPGRGTFAKSPPPNAVILSLESKKEKTHPSFGKEMRKNSELDRKDLAV